MYLPDLVMFYLVASILHHLNGLVEFQNHSSCENRFWKFLEVVLKDNIDY